MKKILITFFLLLFLIGCENKEEIEEPVESYNGSILESVHFDANSYKYDKEKKNWIYETNVLIRDDVAYDEFEYDYELTGKYIDISFESRNYKDSKLVHNGNHVIFTLPSRFLDEYEKQGSSIIASHVTIRFKTLKDCEEIKFSVKNIALRNSRTGEGYEVKNADKLIRCPQDLSK